MATTRDVVASHYTIHIKVERTDKVLYSNQYRSREDAVIPMDEVFEEVSFKTEQDAVRVAVAIVINMLTLQYPGEPGA